ncbi:hypothetical protein E2C01_018040 [Portunus trituberculatus]|uniref:Uncharacterized protein n=1 Tax=Portunus trituberculatus TaxID=210409 RepID=A0A5B7DVF2_PORTR|nr:hypothetical protein [Portunus trituberculatus]
MYSSNTFHVALFSLWIKGALKILLPTAFLAVRSIFFYRCSIGAGGRGTGKGSQVHPLYSGQLIEAQREGKDGSSLGWLASANMLGAIALLTTARDGGQ